MFFVAATLHLRLSEGQNLAVADGRYVHAALLRAISDVDPRSGQILHDMGRHKRFTSAIVGSQRQITKLRVTFMAQDGLDYATILINALSQRPTLRLGQVVGEVDGIDVGTGDWSGVSTWFDLQQETVVPMMRFTFITPTAIMKDDAWGGRFTLLYPEALEVFAGLARRWRALEGPTLPENLEHFVSGGGCFVAQHQLRTVAFHTPERVQIGFVGYVVYKCRRQEPTYLAALNALTRLAFFTGVGYQTTRGMGLTRTTLSS
jgi:CRISPR-associated endoribonuclease Cas6